MKKKKSSGKPKSFLFRWLVSSVAMFVCLSIFGHFGKGAEHTWLYYVLAGLVFSLVNSLIKPLATLLSLPILVITFGAFTVVINALMMALTIKILPGVEMSFWGVVGSCLIVAIVNWLANLLTDSVK